MQKIFLREQADDVQKLRIDGMRLIWNSATSLSVGAGSCYTENGDYIRTTGSITKSGLTLTASTFHHVYVYVQNNAPAAEVVTTAPVAWMGTAYSKTGDKSRRYVGSILATGTNTMANFIHNPDQNSMFYLQQNDALPFRVLTNGTQQTSTDINLSTVLPITAKSVYFHGTNTNTTYIVFLSNSLSGLVPYGAYLLGINNAKDAYITMPTNNSQIINYAISGAGNGLYVDVYGYNFER